MIWEIVKKQIVIFVRNRIQLLLLLGLPVVLIVILSVSLSNFINGNIIEIEEHVAFIEHSDEKEQIKRFIEEVRRSDLDESEKATIITITKDMTPIHHLKHDV